MVLLCAAVLTLTFLDEYKIFAYNYFYSNLSESKKSTQAKRARHYQGCTNSSWCGICVNMHMPRICNVGGVRSQPFFVCASSFKCANQLKRHGH